MLTLLLLMAISMFGMVRHGTMLVRSLAQLARLVRLVPPALQALKEFRAIPAPPARLVHRVSKGL